MHGQLHSCRWSSTYVYCLCISAAFMCIDSAGPLGEMRKLASKA